MTDLREHAAALAGFYERQGVPHAGLAYRLLADRGEDNTFTPLPEGETCGQAKNCYGNSTMRALDFYDRGPKLTYYEGLAYDLIPFEHAWCQDEDGRVYEMTLRHNDDACPFCYGEGEVGVADHWDYDAPDEDDEDEFFDESETVTCEQCGGTGKTKPRDRSDVTYLGVPVSTDTLREIVLRRRVYGALFEDPVTVAGDLGVNA